MKRAAICFLVKKDGENYSEVLLKKYKEGFCADKWNGAAGVIEKDEEDLENAMVRQTEEILGVTALTFDKVAEISFIFPDKKEWDQLVHVYLCTEWDGEVKEDDKTKTYWFKREKIPYDDMFTSDIFWVPKILTGKKIKTIVVYRNDFSITDQVTDTVEEL
ncbi:MAG: NUDIX domain-containing protein [Patescibacteria group bacterium]